MDNIIIQSKFRGYFQSKETSNFVFLSFICNVSISSSFSSLFLFISSLFISSFSGSRSYLKERQAGLLGWQAVSHRAHSYLSNLEEKKIVFKTFSLAVYLSNLERQIAFSIWNCPHFLPSPLVYFKFWSTRPARKSLQQ